MRKLSKTQPPIPAPIEKHTATVGLNMLQEEIAVLSIEPKPLIVYKAGEAIGVYVPLCVPMWSGVRKHEVAAKRLEIEAWYIAREIEKFGFPGY
jgi:hypothetical protein